jgi:hypothetical protein
VKESKRPKSTARNGCATKACRGVIVSGWEEGEKKYKGVRVKEYKSAKGQEWNNTVGWEAWMWCHDPSAACRKRRGTPVGMTTEGRGNEEVKERKREREKERKREREQETQEHSQEWLCHRGLQGGNSVRVGGGMG